MAVLTGQFFSKALKRTISFSAALPVDGPEGCSAGPFPTLYLLHGYTANHMEWLYNGNVMQLANDHHMAIIMPDGDNSFYLNNPHTEKAYSDFLGQELIEVTRKLFPLSHERKDTYIGGLSMGGFGALRNGLFHSDVFGAVVALSSALITDEVANMKPGQGNPVASYEYYVNTFGDPATLAQSDRAPKFLAAQRKEQGKALPRIFMACGTEDFLYPANVDMHEHLEKLGVPHEWVTRQGVHNFEFWNYALPIALDWIEAGK